jgi:hypothetical protein
MLSEQLLESQAAIWKAGTSSLKRVTGKMFPFRSDFIEPRKTLFLIFFHKRIAKNCENHHALIPKRTV